MAKTKKTTLFIEVDDKEFTVSYSGKYDEPQTPEQRKHNERLIRILISNDKLLEFLYNIVTPAVRYKRRQARKQAQRAKQLVNPYKTLIIPLKLPVQN